MLAVWKSGFKSDRFKAYLGANVAGMLVSLLVTGLASDRNTFAMTLLTFSIGIAITVMLDLWLETVPVESAIRPKVAMVFFIMLISMIFGILVKDGIHQILLMAIFTLAMFFSWGVIYSYDSKFQVDVPDRETYTPRQVQDKPLSRSQKNRDVKF